MLIAFDGQCQCWVYLQYYKRYIYNIYILYSDIIQSWRIGFAGGEEDEKAIGVVWKARELRI